MPQPTLAIPMPSAVILVSNRASSENWPPSCSLCVLPRTRMTPTFPLVAWTPVATLAWNRAMTPSRSSLLETPCRREKKEAILGDIASRSGSKTKTLESISSACTRVLARRKLSFENADSGRQASFAGCPGLSLFSRLVVSLRNSSKSLVHKCKIYTFTGIVIIAVLIP